MIYNIISKLTTPLPPELLHKLLIYFLKLRVIKKIKNPNIKINREDLNMEKYFLLEEMYV